MGWNFIKKEALAQVFSCQFCEISQNTFFYSTPPVAASIQRIIQSIIHDLHQFRIKYNKLHFIIYFTTLCYIYDVTGCKYYQFRIIQFYYKMIYICFVSFDYKVCYTWFFYLNNLNKRFPTYCFIFYRSDILFIFTKGMRRKDNS